MPPSIDEPVRKAYEMIRVDILKKEQPELLKASDEFFASLTEHDQAIREQSEEKALEKVAKKLIFDGMSVEKVVEITGLSQEQIGKLKDKN